MGEFFRRLVLECAQRQSNVVLHRCPQTEDAVRRLKETSKMTDARDNTADEEESESGEEDLVVEFECAICHRRFEDLAKVKEHIQIHGKIRRGAETNYFHAIQTAKKEDVDETIVLDGDDDDEKEEEKESDGEIEIIEPYVSKPPPAPEKETDKRKERSRDDDNEESNKNNIGKSDSEASAPPAKRQKTSGDENDTCIVILDDDVDFPESQSKSATITASSVATSAPAHSDAAPSKPVLDDDDDDDLELIDFRPSHLPDSQVRSRCSSSSGIGSSSEQRPASSASAAANTSFPGPSSLPRPSSTASTALYDQSPRPSSAQSMRNQRSSSSLHASGSSPLQSPSSSHSKDNLPPIKTSPKTPSNISLGHCDITSRSSPPHLQGTPVSDGVDSSAESSRLDDIAKSVSLLSPEERRRLQQMLSGTSPAFNEVRPPTSGTLPKTEIMSPPMIRPTVAVAPVSATSSQSAVNLKISPSSRPLQSGSGTGFAKPTGTVSGIQPLPRPVNPVSASTFLAPFPPISQGIALQPLIQQLQQQQLPISNDYLRQLAAMFLHSTQPVNQLLSQIPTQLSSAPFALPGSNQIPMPQLHLQPQDVQNLLANNSSGTGSNFVIDPALLRQWNQSNQPPQ